jgi:5-bromo-4-chloroindolyl phosphate hydrolysis protein
MSYRRRVRDDLVDVVFDVIRSASASRAAPVGDEAAMKAQAEREAARQVAREEKQRRREQAAIRQYAGVGAGLLAGGLASMIALPTVAAVGIGLLTGGAVSMIVKGIQNGTLLPLGPTIRLPQKPRAIDPPEVDGRDIPKSQRDVVQAILDESALSLRKLDAVGRALAGKDVDAAALCDRLVAAGERLSDAVADEPMKFPVAQRVLTYHLTKAVFVAETFQSLEPEHYEKRAAEARHLLTRMEMVFEKAILDMSSVDAAEMDLEMRLINQALDEDLNTDKPRGKA